MKLSLIIPCYNEAKNLPLLVERCRLVIRADESVEVVLVDNGSTDDTPSVLTRLLSDTPGCRTVRVDVNQGYGFGILSGLRAAEGDVLAWTHADMQTDPMDVLAALALFREAGASGETLMIKGRRRGRPLFDRIFTAGMSLFETVLTGHLMLDINAQPTVFHRRFFESWGDPPCDFSLDLYAYWQAKAAELRLRRIPVFFGSRAHGESHWNTGMSAKWKFIRRTIEYSLKLRKQQSS